MHGVLQKRDARIITIYMEQGSAVKVLCKVYYFRFQRFITDILSKKNDCDLHQLEFYSCKMVMTKNLA